MTRKKARRRRLYWRLSLGWGGRMVVKAVNRDDALLIGLMFNERFGVIGQVEVDGPYARGEVPRYTSHSR